MWVAGRARGVHHVLWPPVTHRQAPSDHLQVALDPTVCLFATSWVVEGNVMGLAKMQ